MLPRVVTGSYHAGVFALAVGIPTVGLVGSPYYAGKFEGLAHQFGRGCAVVSLGEADAAGRVAAAVDELWDAADEVRPSLVEAAASWDERARDAVRLWRDTRGTWVPEPRTELVVGDLGAGSERLRPALADGMPQPHRYLAYDLHPQLPSTERLDVLSEMPDQSFDVVFCLGLLEYVPPGNSFPARLASTCRFAVVSYVATDLEPLTAEERRERDWVSHYSREQLEALFEAEGFVRDAFTTTERGRSGVWLWSAPREPRATSSGAAPR